MNQVINRLQTDSVSKLFAQNDVILAYLFGSLARGKTWAGSDVDIATHIVTADFHFRADEYREMISQLGKVGVVDPEFAQKLAPFAGF